jgi:hypothetical protein
LFLFADVVVEYVEGNVEARNGTRWSDVYIGDSIASAGAVRLGDGGYVELKDGSRVIKLTRPGTYEISALSSGTQRTASAGLGGLVLGRISRLSGNQAPQQDTAAGGARASEAVTTNQMQWAGSLESLVEEGVAFLEEGYYQDAYWAFEDAYGGALDAELPQLTFYLGYSSLMMGEVQAAAEWLEEYSPDASTPYYAVHVLALGQLLVESFAYQDAIDHLAPLAADSRQEAEDRQSAQLMMGISYSGLGMNTQARQYLVQAQQTAPGTDAAAVAGKLINEL